MSLKPTISGVVGVDVLSHYYDHNTICHIIAMSSFLQPRWMVTSAKPKDLEDGWKQICNNADMSLLGTRHFKSQKRLSDFSGLVSTQIRIEFENNLVSSI